MTRSPVDQVAAAVLYEGYILYPYRPSSVKNRQRWTFGGIYPKAYSDTQMGSDIWEMRCECLLEAGPGAKLSIRVRFLHLLERSVGELTSPLPGWPTARLPVVQAVPQLHVGDRTYRAWQEATERELVLEAVLPDLQQKPLHQPFLFAAAEQFEPIADPAGAIIGVLIRRQGQLEGEVAVSAQNLEGNLSRVTVQVRNRTALPAATAQDRELALRHTLVASHVVLQVCEGAFVSLLDPPERWKTHAAACQNVGVWPVLAGADGATDTVLGSPIILYDYPQIAPESPQDLFDATEIDEILTLRILTLTEEEKREICTTDERARQLLARAETLAQDQLLSLHGTLRNLRPATEKEGNP